MSRKKIVLIGLLSGLLITIVVGAVFLRFVRENEKMNNDINQLGRVTQPLIDAAVSERIETATFALG